MDQTSRLGLPVGIREPHNGDAQDGPSVTSEVPSDKLSDKPSKASFSKQVQEDKQAKKQYEDAMKELEEKKDSIEKLQLKTKEVHQEVKNEKNSLAAEESKMKLHYESKMKILDIKVKISMIKPEGLRIP